MIWQIIKSAAQWLGNKIVGMFRWLGIKLGIITTTIHIPSPILPTDKVEEMIAHDPSLGYQPEKEPVAAYFNQEQFVLQVVIEAIKEGASNAVANTGYNALAQWFLPLGKPEHIKELESKLVVTSSEVKQKLLENIRDHFLFQIQKDVVDHLLAFLKAYLSAKSLKPAGLAISSEPDYEKDSLMSTKVHAISVIISSAGAADQAERKEDTENTAEAVLIEQLKSIGKYLAKHYQIAQNTLKQYPAPEAEVYLIEYMLQAIIRHQALKDFKKMKKHLKDKKFLSCQPSDHEKLLFREQLRLLQGSLAQSWGLSSSTELTQFFLFPIATIKSDCVFTKGMTATLKTSIRIAKRYQDKTQKTTNDEAKEMTDTIAHELLALCESTNSHYEHIIGRIETEYARIEMSQAEGENTLVNAVKSLKEKLFNTVKAVQIKSLIKRVLLRMAKIDKRAYTNNEIDEAINEHFDDFLSKNRFRINTLCKEANTENNLVLLAKQYHNKAIYQLFFTDKKEGYHLTTAFNGYAETAESYDRDMAEIHQMKNNHDFTAAVLKKDDVLLQHRVCRHLLRETERMLLEYLRKISAKQERTRTVDVYLTDRASEANKYLACVQFALSTNELSKVKEEMDSIYHDPTIKRGWRITEFLLGYFSLWYKLHPMVEDQLKKIASEYNKYTMLQPGKQKIILDNYFKQLEAKRAARAAAEAKFQAAREARIKQLGDQLKKLIQIDPMPGSLLK